MLLIDDGTQKKGFSIGDSTQQASLTITSSMLYFIDSLQRDIGFEWTKASDGFKTSCFCAEQSKKDGSEKEIAYYFDGLCNLCSRILKCALHLCIKSVLPIHSSAWKFG